MHHLETSGSPRPASQPGFSWAHFRALVERLTDGITVQDGAGRLVYANELGARSSGYASPEELLAAPVGDYVRKFEVMDQTGAPIKLEDLPGRRALRDGEARRILRVLERETGRIRWTDVASFAIRDDDGRIEFVVNVIRDVTGSFESLHAAEARGAAATEHVRWLSRLQQLTVGLSRSVTVADAIDTATNMARQAFEADAVELWMVSEDRAYLDLCGSYGTDEMRRAVSKVAIDAELPPNAVLALGEPVVFETPESISDQFPLRRELIAASGVGALACAPVKVAGNIIGVLTFRYHTPRTFSDNYMTAFRTFSKELGQALDRTRIHAELVQARRAAEEAKRAAEAANGAKSAFLATMSHELRTPINAILGFSELLELGIAEGREMAGADYVRRIRKNTEQLLQLINDILDWSKVEAGQLVIDTGESLAGDVVREALGVVRLQANARGVELSAECAPEIVYVGDPLRVRQVLLNLLSNAIKFTPAGGQVTVSCRTVNKTTSFAVTDTGIGIDPQDHDRIFEPFLQTANVYTREAGGTGLGLSISRRLAELMGGRLDVVSTLGHGATFTLSLPAKERRRRQRQQ